MKCDLVVVNHGTYAAALTAIKSVQRSIGKNLGEIIVIENGTGEGAHFKSCRLIEFPENRGYAAGVNAGVGLSAKLGKAELICVINPDLVFVDGPWSALLESHHARIAAIGPRILARDGSIQASIYGEPRPMGPVIELLGINRIAGRAGIRRKMPETRVEVPSLQGSCLFISHGAWEKVGPFDDEFFLYHEETDWCLRARDMGLVNIYDPSVSIIHDGGLDVPLGRESVYFRGAVKLAEKRHGAVPAEKLKRRLRLVARIKGMALEL